MRALVQFIIILLTILLSSTTVSVAEKTKKNIEFQQNLKLSTMSKKKSIKLIKEGIDKIKENCCEENFYKKRRVIQIKNNLEKCLLEKCYDTYKIIFTLPRPKITALKQVNEIDDLLIENDKQKYENVNKQKDIDDQLRLKKVQNEKDIAVLKENIKEMSKENIKLKKTVDKMLSNYQKKIINLENENKKLENENKKLENKFNTAYEMLPKRSKKKIDELVFE